MIRNTEKQKILLQSGQKIFTTAGLAVLWDISNRNSLIKTIERYVSRGILFRIYKGLYSTLPLEKLDEYEIGCAIGGSFSYISAETVLSKNGIILQDIKKVTLFAKKQKEVTIGKTTYLCRYLNNQYLLNRVGIKDEKGYAVATVERALADIRHINPKFFVDNQLSVNEKDVNKLSKEIGYHQKASKNMLHQHQLFLILREILSDSFLAQNLVLKDNTYASLRGVLERFSVDLDFDLPEKKEKGNVRKRCYEIFKKLNFEIKDESKKHLQFFLKYDAPEGERNTLKLEINDDVSKNNTYEKVLLKQINMYCNGHTLDTMFANKLVACKARFDKNGKIAGRDFYDIYQFFLQGIEINKKVVEERTGLTYEKYLESLIPFIKKNVTKKLLNQDLNPLMNQKDLDNILPHLESSLIMMIEDEKRRK
jgi:predicted nucleotidyltransferase component of viral defense system